MSRQSLVDLNRCKSYLTFEALCRKPTPSNKNIFVAPYPDGESLEDDDGLELLPGDEGEHPGGEQGAAGHDDDGEDNGHF